MTLQASGSMSSTQILTELNSAGPFELTGTRERTLAGVPSGPITMPTNFYSKSRAALTGTGSGSTSGGTANIIGVAFGAAGTGSQRRIFCTVGWQGTTANAGAISSATIAGVAASIHNQRSGAATTNAGCAIISAFLDAGTSGNVSINFNQADARNVLIGVFRMVGVTINAGASDQADFGVGAQRLTVNNNLLANGFALISGVTSLNAPVGDITFEGATEAYEGALGANVRAGGALSDHIGPHGSYPCSIVNTVPSGIGGFFISTIVGS